MTIYVEAHLTIGFPTAEHKETLEFPDGTSADEIAFEVREWAFGFIEISHDVVEPEDESE